MIMVSKSSEVISRGTSSLGDMDANNDEQSETSSQYTFVPLSSEEMEQRLEELAQPQTATFADIHSVTLQPCLGYKSQDRHVVRQLDVHGQLWTFTGVFDGHLGDATVEHTAYHLPIIVKESLEQAMSTSSASKLGIQTVSELLSRSITSFDEAIAGDVLELFPGGVDSLPGRSNDEIRSVVNDYSNGGENYQKAKLAMYGTTALIALVDPEHTNLWIANLGDCEAVLVTHSEDGSWSSEALTAVHNGGNQAEVERVQREHPGEPEAVLDERVLGAIAPFRSIGDAPFKQPATFTRRVLYNLYPGIPDSTPWDTFLDRNKSPPYISSHPDITHRRLRKRSSSSSSSYPRFHLILATDGLTDLYDGSERQAMIDDWASCISMIPRRSSPSVLPSFLSGLPALFSALTPASLSRILQGHTFNQGRTDSSTAVASNNLALRLLRRALGGEPVDVSKVSELLTMDMDSPWMDDTTIIVQAL